jgi:hypothetical protein
MSTKKEKAMLLKRVLYILAPLALILTATSCEGKPPGSPEPLTPSETIAQETEPGGNPLVASPTDYIEPPVTSTTAPPTETMPVIAYENAIPHYAAGTEFIISQQNLSFPRLE